MVYRNSPYNSMNMDNELPVSQNNLKPYNKMAPTMTPSLSPTMNSKMAPTMTPSLSPTMNSKMAPTMMPSLSPTMNSKMAPTMMPSLSPTMNSTMAPTMNSSMSPAMMPSKTPTMTLPTGVPSGPPYGGATLVPPGGPLPSAVPQTVQNPYFTAGFLKKYIGRDVRVEFLMGTSGPLIDRIGTLLEVGASFIVIRPIRSNDSLMCDLYSIKFVTIYS